MSFSRRTLLSSSVLAIVVALAACGVTSGATTNALTGTPTATTVSGCAATLGFAEATPASAGTRFPDVSFPSGSLSYSTTLPEANGFQSRLVHVCATGATGDAVRSFYSSDLPGHGWVAQDTAPVSGDLSAPCPSKPFCFGKNNGALRYLVVEDVTPGTGLTVYTLHLIIQPLVIGSASLATGGTLDLDPTGPGAGVADLSLTTTQLAPTGSAKFNNLGVKGSLNAVTYPDLAALTYTTAPLPTSILTVGETFAAATADGHYAKVRITAATSAQLTLDYITYPYTF